MHRKVILIGPCSCLSCLLLESIFFTLLHTNSFPFHCKKGRMAYNSQHLLFDVPILLKLYPGTGGSTKCCWSRILEDIHSNAKIGLTITLFVPSHHVNDGIMHWIIRRVTSITMSFPEKEWMYDLTICSLEMLSRLIIMKILYFLSFLPSLSHEYNTIFGYVVTIFMYHSWLGTYINMFLLFWMRFFILNCMK